jgi:hypothetical protein
MFIAYSALFFVKKFAPSSYGANKQGRSSSRGAGQSSRSLSSSLRCTQDRLATLERENLELLNQIQKEHADNSNGEIIEESRICQFENEHIERQIKSTQRELEFLKAKETELNKLLCEKEASFGTTLRDLALFCKEEAHIDRSIGTHDFILDPSIPGQQENGEYRKMKALSRDLEIRVEDIVAVLYTSRDGGMNPFFSRLVT